MTLWRKARTEAAGAWRSVQYDLRRPEPAAGKPGARPRTGGPEATSTGFHTFSGAGLTGGPRASYGERFVARPRRLAAVSAFGVLAVVGAAGSYFAVVNGIGALVGEQPAGVEPYPLAAEAPRGTEGDLATSGLGRGTAHPAGRASAVPGPPAEPAPAAVRVLPTTAAAPVPPRVTAPRPRQTTVGVEPETPPDGCCLNPPVPTPTAPVPTPYNPSASPSPAESSPDGSGSPEPSESPASAVPSGSAGSADPEDGGIRVHRARRY